MTPAEAALGAGGGCTARLQARTAFPSAAFTLPHPRVLRVLRIENPIRLAVNLTLRPAS